MSTQEKKPTAIFPDLERERKVVNELGEWTPFWQLFFDNQTMALQQNFSNEGFAFPPLNTAQINAIQNLYSPYIGQPYQTMLKFLPDISGKRNIFDVDSRVPKIFIITFDNTPSQIILTAQWKTYQLV